MTSLKENIINQKPREKAGPTSANRFDYQKDWSLCQLLEYQQNNSDYLFIFDYHEDLLILNSEKNPDKISFYQIKGSKSTNWTIDRLIKSEKDKDGNPLLSILGKLYDCKSKFDLETSSLNFVTNSRFNIKLQDNKSGISKDQICIFEIADKDKKKIKEKLINEHSLKNDPIFENVTFLKVTELSLDDSSTHSKGKLIDFLNRFNPNGKYSIPALYQSLFDEVKRRTSYNKEIYSFEELIEKKGIGKTMLDSWLENIISKDFDELWRRIETRLNSEGFAINEIKHLHSAWREFELSSLNHNNEIVRKIQKRIKDIYILLDDNGELNKLDLKDSLNQIYIEYIKDPISQTAYNQHFIKAAILNKIYD